MSFRLNGKEYQDTKDRVSMRTGNSHRRPLSGELRIIRVEQLAALYRQHEKNEVSPFDLPQADIQTLFAELGS